MPQTLYFRCAMCGEIVAISFSSYTEADEEGVQELESTEKCFSCGYTPFRVRELLPARRNEFAPADWPE